MKDVVVQQEPRADIISALRAAAEHGATVRELVTEIRTRLGCKDDPTFPVLWYFIKAFCLRLPDVLPIGDWLVDLANDEEIDILILPRIRSAREKWLPSNNGSAALAISEAIPEGHDLSITE